MAPSVFPQWWPIRSLIAQESPACSELPYTHTHRSLKVSVYISTTAGPIVYCQWSQTSLKFNLIYCKPKCQALRWQLKALLSDNWMTLANNSLCTKQAGADILRGTCAWEWLREAGLGLRAADPAEPRPTLATPPVRTHDWLRSDPRWPRSQATQPQSWLLLNRRTNCPFPAVQSSHCSLPSFGGCAPVLPWLRFWSPSSSRMWSASSQTNHPSQKARAQTAKEGRSALSSSTLPGEWAPPTCFFPTPTPTKRGTDAKTPSTSTSTSSSCPAKKSWDLFSSRRMEHGAQCRL